MKRRHGRRWGKRKKQRRNWRKYDKKLVRRGELLIPLNATKNWQKQVARQNKGKTGRPFDYPDAFIEQIGFWKCFCKLDYRSCQGLGNQLAILLCLPGAPHYSIICRRLRRLGKVHYMKRKKSNDKPVYAVFDGTGVKVCNRGEWMHYKHKGKRKGFVRIVWAVDAKSGKVLEFSATTEKVGDNKKFKPLLGKLCKNHKVKKAGGDGAFDSYGNFEELRKRKIRPAIKIRKSSSSTGPPEIKPYMKARLREVGKIEKWGYEKWAEKRQYGKRWMVETQFSCFKGYFGEYVYSKGMNNIKSEIGLKVHFLNKLHGF